MVTRRCTQRQLLFWASSEKTSMVHLVDAEAALDKMVYALTNPVAAQLVARATEWPGASSLIAQLNSGSITVKRPKVYFPDDSTLPDEVTLRFVRPDGLEHLSDEDYKALLRDKIAAVEVMAASEREAKGTRVSGVAGVKNQSPFSYPKTSPPRRELSPRVACRNKWRRIEQLRRNKRFELAYREAFDALRAGVRDVLFPAGTWKLVQLGLVSCVPP